VSDEQPSEYRPSGTPDVGEVRDMLPGPSGGKLMRGGNPRPTNPTPADVAAMARKRLYQVIPQLNRIATNKPRREGRSKKLKRPHSTANQLRAIAELRLVAQDRSLSESQISANLMATAAEIYEYLPRDQAQALLAKIGPHWLKT
jgi:hypothetical protein